MKHLGRNTFANASEQNNNALLSDKGLKMVIVTDLRVHIHTQNVAIDWVIYPDLGSLTTQSSLLKISFQGVFCNSLKPPAAFSGVPAFVLSFLPYFETIILLQNKITFFFYQKINLLYIFRYVIKRDFTQTCRGFLPEFVWVKLMTHAWNKTSDVSENKFYSLFCAFEIKEGTDTKVIELQDG